jgi:hypothetical protein
MVDLAITTSQVLPGTASDATFAQGIAGSTITAGQAVYLDTSVGQYKLADNNDSIATAVAVGIALHGALAGQPLRIQTGGDITIGAAAAAVPGTIYCVSATPGGICPAVDLGSGKRTSILAVAKTASVLQLRLNNSGVLA